MCSFVNSKKSVEKCLGMTLPAAKYKHRPKQKIEVELYWEPTYLFIHKNTDLASNDYIDVTTFFSGLVHSKHILFLYCAI